MDNDAISIKFLRKIRHWRYELVISETGFGFHERKRWLLNCGKRKIADFFATSVDDLL